MGIRASQGLPRIASDSHVVIAGGGIGGLATGLALAKSGISSTIVERRQDSIEEGAGIQIGPNGTRILEFLGVATHLSPHAGRPEAISVRATSNGRALTRLPLGGWIERRHGSAYWTAHRSDLHAALRRTIDAEPLVTLKCGRSVRGVEDCGHSVVVTLDSQEQIAGTVLVVADGLWSDLRTNVDPSFQLRFSGRCAMRSVVSMDRVPIEFRDMVTGLWIGRDCHVVHYPVRAGRELAIVVVVADERADVDWGHEIGGASVSAATAHVAPDLAALIRSAEQWKRWSLFQASPTQRLAKGRIALVGDAGHPVLPFLAQGAVLALEDAFVLASELMKMRDDLAQALASFERLRLDRVRRVAQASARNGWIYHLSGPLGMARDATLRLSSPEALMSSYDWLYGWRA
ncbi:MAG: FAD-dependent monooxygenase [Hyphomicrobium sp.]|nr:FAD-dependent monooxygenase [Hyphomicrobium sp.]